MKQEMSAKTRRRAALVAAVIWTVVAGVNVWLLVCEWDGRVLVMRIVIVVLALVNAVLNVINFRRLKNEE